jgi:hypothetical protein
MKFGFYKQLGISHLAEQLTASQEEFWSPIFCNSGMRLMLGLLILWPHVSAPGERAF